ncbi:MAG: MBL fold metallo-hydrolase [Phycisphaeraceae bacterium]|nr:MBL fold metallo-hydrolase [Phycisphaeraceae bacterium]
MDYRVISIGSLSQHELWNERGQSRTPHATTTLIRSGDRVILVDPGLPPQVITARLQERSGLEPSAVTDVFLTNFRPAHRRGISAFTQARWLISETERENVGRALVEMFQREKDEATQRILQEEISILKTCAVAPDRIAPQVDLFPLPGFTPGTAGLLLAFVNSTVLIAGDAVATSEHLEQGRVLRGAVDAGKAKESLVEAIEIADVIIPGHDNMVINPTRKAF